MGANNHIVYPNLTTLRYVPNRREMRRILFDLIIDDGEFHRFIDWGEPNCRRGPGDKTGASLAFDLYDFAMGTYRYHI